MAAERANCLCCEHAPGPSPDCVCRCHGWHDSDTVKSWTDDDEPECDFCCHEMRLHPGGGAVCRGNDGDPDALGACDCWIDPRTNEQVAIKS